MKVPSSRRNSRHFSVFFFTLCLVLIASLPLSAESNDRQLQSSPSRISFGNISVGSSRSLVANLTNWGRTTVTISTVSVSAGDFVLSEPNLPVTVGPREHIILKVTFTPAHNATEKAIISVTGSALVYHRRSSTPTSSPLSLAVPLTGTGTGNGTTPGRTTSSPAALSFGDVQIGKTQALATTITNSGGSSITISQASVSGTGFSVSGATLPLTLAAGQSTSFNVGFAPTSAGGATGSLTISSTASDPMLGIALSGTGVTPGALTIAPTSVAFGNVQTGSSQKLSAILSNTGGSSVTISQVSAAGTGFSASGVAVPSVLSPGQSLSLSVAFAPQASGTTSGTLTVSSNASNVTLTAPLSGTGVAAGVLSANPTTLSFGSVQTGTNKVLTDTLTNSGGSTLTITQATTSGTEFSLTGLSLPLTLAAGQNTSFSVTFAPQTTAAATGSISISTNASSSPLVISLAGSGIAPGALSVTPASLGFGNVQVGSSSLLSETLRNSGGSAVTISQDTITGSGFTLSGLTLPMTLSAGQSFTFGVTFAPQASGNASGSLLLTSSSPISNVTVPLSGMGTSPSQLSVSPASLSFGSVTVGSTNGLPATLTVTGSNVTVSSATPSTAEFSVTGLALPATIAAGQSVAFTVVFAPQASGAASGKITFASNASNSTALSLSGTGAAPPQHSVSLSWSPSTSTVSGYNIYRTAQSGGPYSKINSSLAALTSYTDTSVLSGQSYFYVTTAVNSSGAESGFSNEVQVSVP